MVFNFVFERIFFLFGMMLFFLIIFALLLQLSDMSADYTLMSKELNLFGAAIAISIVITLITCIIINGVYPSTRLFPLIMKRAYTPIYVIYQSTFIFVLAFNYTQEYVLYILLAMSLLFMIFNIVYQPYPEKIHNFVLVFHQLVIMLALGTYLFEILNTPTENETFYTIMIFVIVFCLFACVFLNIYRIWRYHKYCKDMELDLYNYTITPDETGKLNIDEAHEDLLKNNVNSSRRYGD